MSDASCMVHHGWPPLSPASPSASPNVHTSTARLFLLACIPQLAAVRVHGVRANTCMSFLRLALRQRGPKQQTLSGLSYLHPSVPPSGVDALTPQAGWPCRTKHERACTGPVPARTKLGTLRCWYPRYPTSIRRHATARVHASWCQSLQVSTDPVVRWLRWIYTHAPPAPPGRLQVLGL
ncbi:hypothetical protein CI102_7283, partial [Trichoderma harzianum]